MKDYINWLNTEDNEKVQLIRLLDAESLSLDELSKRLHKSAITIKKNLESFNEECKNFNIESFQINFDKGYTNKITISSGNEALLIMKNRYAYKSNMLYLLHSAILNTTETVLGFCLKRNISNSSFWRIFKDTNLLLKKYNLKVSTSKGIHCEGNEITLRILIAKIDDLFSVNPNFFLGADLEFFRKASAVLDLLPEKIYPLNDYKERNFFTLLLFMTRSRIKIKSFIVNDFIVPLYRTNNDVLNLKKYLGIRPLDDDSYEADFICSLLLSFRPYASQEGFIVSKAWLSTSEEGQKLLDTNCYLMRRLVKQMTIPLDDKDYMKLLNATLMVDYRTLLLPIDVLKILEEDLPPVSVLTQRHFFKEKNAIEEIELKNNPFMEKFKGRVQYLVPAILEVTSATIGVQKYIPRIKIMLLSRSGSHIQRQSLKLNGFFDEFNLEISNSRFDTVDLILLDATIPTSVVNSNNVEKMYWKPIPTEKDLTRVRKKLIELTNQRKK